MSQFEPALSFILNFEDPQHLYAVKPDNKGLVLAGINSLAFPNQFVAISSAAQIQRPTLVSNFYRTQFWNPMRLGGIYSQDIANRVLDMGVNAGMRTAIELLQRAVNTLMTATTLPPGLTVDGILGPDTMAAVNGVDPDCLLAAFKTTRLAYYEGLPGWSNPNIRQSWTTRAEA